MKRPWRTTLSFRIKTSRVEAGRGAGSCTEVQKMSQLLLWPVHAQHLGNFFMIYFSFASLNKYLSISSWRANIPCQLWLFGWPHLTTRRVSTTTTHPSGRFANEQLSPKNPIAKLIHQLIPNSKQGAVTAHAQKQSSRKDAICHSWQLCVFPRMRFSTICVSPRMRFPASHIPQQ